MEQLIGIGAIFTLAAGANVFFLKRLVSKIDKIDLIDSKFSAHNEQFKSLQEKISQLSDQVRDVSDLKADVAVLMYAIAGKISRSGIKPDMRE